VSRVNRGNTPESGRIHLKVGIQCILFSVGPGRKNDHISCHFFTKWKKYIFHVTIEYPKIFINWTIFYVCPKIFNNCTIFAKFVSHFSGRDGYFYSSIFQISWSQQRNILVIPWYIFMLFNLEQADSSQMNGDNPTKNKAVYKHVWMEYYDLKCLHLFYGGLRQDLHH